MVAALTYIPANRANSSLHLCSHHCLLQFVFLMVVFLKWTNCNINVVIDLCFPDV